MFYLYYNEKLLIDSKERVENCSIEYLERLDEFLLDKIKKSFYCRSGTWGIRKDRTFK